MKRWLLLALEAVCNRKAHQIVVPTEEVKTLLTQRQGVPAGKVSVIPYALEQQLYTPSSPTAAAALRALHGLEGRKLVVAACRLNPEKGLEHLLAAFQLVKGEVLGARLALLGTGPRDAVLRRLALDLGLKEEVLFLGWQDNVLDWLAAADVVVQPSECESYCQVLVEAMAVGTPVIMTPVGAAPEIIGADERGRLVPKRDAEALARALIELLSQPDKARVLGLAGQAFVRKSLNPANIRDKHQALYLSLLGLDRE
jgi:glycosyltransferase involved in cell wall biosynthesis